MSDDFGDDAPEDSYVEDNEADPEPVARRLHELRRDRGLEFTDWDDLIEEHRRVLVAVVTALLLWLRREGTQV